jgi:hypothetical protein
MYFSQNSHRACTHQGQQTHSKIYGSLESSYNLPGEEGEIFNFFLSKSSFSQVAASSLNFQALLRIDSQGYFGCFPIINVILYIFFYQIISTYCAGS